MINPQQPTKVIYRVDYDTRFAKFDESYPDFLQELITESEYQHVVETCSSHTTKLRKICFAIAFFMAITGLFTIPALLIWICVSVMENGLHYSVMATAGLLIQVPAIMIAIFFVYRMLTVKTHDTIKNFLDYENELRYLDRGVKFVLRWEHGMYNQNPCIEIFAPANAVQRRDSQRSTSDEESSEDDV